MTTKAVKKVMDLMPKVKDMPAPDDPWTDNILYEAAVLHEGLNRLLKRWPGKYRRKVVDLLRSIADSLEKQGAK